MDHRVGTQSNAVSETHVTEVARGRFPERTQENSQTRPTALIGREWFGRFLITLLVVASLCGCTRTQYRIDADREAYCTIAERNHDPRWAVADFGIEPDSRSRYFDPYNQDCPPMPVDDPASHRYMHCVDGKLGWEHWSDNGVRSALENPRWRVGLADYTELAQDGAVKLDIDSAVRLAYVHSPLHQNALETLYLSSLDVTGERFRLDTQFFGGQSIRYEHQGNVNPAAIAFSPTAGRYIVAGPFPGAESNRMIVASDLQATRRFATAGEVLIGFANSFAFEFTGGDVSLASSLANFSFIQPLLRGAGRDVALEQLTLSERRLLGNLRAYSQFRQGLFTQVVIGELGVNGPQRAGAGTTLQSFSGFGSVNGYLGLLQQAQQIRNTEDNLRLQLRTRDRLEALYDNELIDIVQVDQFRQNIEVTRANLLDQTNSLELAVDNFKTGILGLPADLPLDVDEQLVEDFQLIPIEANPVLERILGLQTRIGDIGELIDLSDRMERLQTSLPTLGNQDFEDAEFQLFRLLGVFEAVSRRSKSLDNDLSSLSNSDRTDAEESLELAQDEVLQIAERIRADADQIPQQLDDASSRLKGILDTFSEDGFAAVVADNSEWLSQTLSLCREIVRIQSAAQNLSSEPGLVLADAQDLIAPVRDLFDTARNDLQRMEEAAPLREQLASEDEKARLQQDRKRIHGHFDELETGEAGFEFAISQLDRIAQSHTDDDRIATVNELTAWIQLYLQIAERLTLIPAQARLEIITVEEVDLEADAAFQIALANRLDFMNGRAALVDRWRAIQVAADALQSNLTVTGGGDISTARNNPVDFRGATSTLRLGLEFDAPLARLLERNGYRESLIQYQRSRRSLIQSRDSLQKGLRALLRTLKQRRLQLEIQRRAVAIALRRVDQTQLSLLTPPPQGQPGVRPQINPTTAINLLGAQGSLQSSQNSFLAAWLNYYAARLRLYRELGVMQLDPSGRWIENSISFGDADTPAADADAGQIADGVAEETAETLPPPLPIEVPEAELLEPAAGR